MTSLLIVFLFGGAVSMLNFSITQSPNQSPVIQIFIDEKGLASLLRTIESARKLGHVHAYAWFGNDRLDEKTPFGAEAVGEVIVDWVNSDEC